MARFTSYPNKSKPADSDTLLINDASASANKQILLSGLFAWLKDKFASSTISELETTDKTIVGAINELKEDLDNIEGGGGSGDGLTSEVKDALLAIFQHVAYADSSGQTYYDALEEALYPTVTTRTVSYSLSHVTSSNNASTVTSGASYTATLTASSGYTINTVTVTMGGADVTSTVYSSGTITIPSVTGNIVITATAVASVSSISAVYTQSGTVYTNTNLNSLKSDLVVTATYTGGTTGTIPGTDYTLSGTLTEGTSTITISYGGKTTTFTVTVTKEWDAEWSYTDGVLPEAKGFSVQMPEDGNPSISLGNDGLNLSTTSNSNSVGYRYDQYDETGVFEIVFSLTSTRTILYISQTEDGKNGIGIRCQNSTNYKGIYLCDAEAIAGMTKICDAAQNTDYKVTLVHNNGTAKIYVDDVLMLDNISIANIFPGTYTQVVLINSSSSGTAAAKIKSMKVGLGRTE